MAIPETFLSTVRVDVTASLPARRLSKPSKFQGLSPLRMDTLVGLSATSNESGMTNHVAMRTSTKGSATASGDLSARWGKKVPN